MVYGGQGERMRGFPDRDAINPLQMVQIRNSECSGTQNIVQFYTLRGGPFLGDGHLLTSFHR
jgi:hypothetical protein